MPRISIIFRKGSIRIFDCKLRKIPNLEKLDEIDEALLLSKQNYELIYELNKPADNDEVRPNFSFLDLASLDRCLLHGWNSCG